MTDKKIKEVMKAMQSIAVDGVCYAHSFNVIKKIDNGDAEKQELIRQIKKSFADSATLCWTKIFGAYSEETHWGKLYGWQEGDKYINDDNELIITQISGSYNYLTAGGFRGRVFKKNNFEKCEGGNAFHENKGKLQDNIKSYRDKYVSHTNVKELADNRITFPYIWPIYKTLTEFSNVLCEIDQKARFSLFPDNGMGQKYSTKRDNLKNRLAQNIQEILKAYSAK